VSVPADRDVVTAITVAEAVATVLAVGHVIGGRYRVVKLLGSGGMADVYEVEHCELQRRFALKLLREDVAKSASLKARFEREVRTVASLVSEYIVAIVDCGVAERGAPYFVMERLYGVELRRLLQEQGALPIPRALHLSIDVCHALHVAHAAGVVHRDVKPENLFLVQSDARAEQCRVLDFGVAKLSGENPTLPGALVGTARYMAPEQISMGTQLGPATDVFALGVILFECLSGKPPFDGDSFERVLFKIVNDAPPDLQRLRPEISQDLVRLVEHMLAKDPEHRPQSAFQVMTELETLLAVAAPHSRAARRFGDDATVAHASASWASSRERSRGPMALALGVGIVLGTGLGAWVMRPRVDSREPGVTTPTTPASSPPLVTATHPAPVLETSRPVASTPTVSVGRSTEAKPSPRLPPKTSASAAVAPKPPLFFPTDAK